MLASYQKPTPIVASIKSINELSVCVMVFVNTLPTVHKSLQCFYMKGENFPY